MNLTDKNAPLRARKLLQEIEGLIARGEFTPEYGYLHFKFGPCGCALAAAGFVCGVDEKTYYDDSLPYGFQKVDLLRNTVEAAGVATIQEMIDFEKGYEEDYDFGNEPRGAFFRAGKKLRQYHPYFVPGRG